MKWDDIELSIGGKPVEMATIDVDPAVLDRPVTARVVQVTIPTVDPGPIRPSGDASLCWGEQCWRSPLPGAGPAVEADPLGLCPRCREEIVGSAPRGNVSGQVD